MQNRSAFVALVAGLSLAGTASAQVFSPAIAGVPVDGNQITSYPFGFTDFRSQIVLDQTTVAGTSAVITAISFRPENNNSSGSPAVTVRNVVIQMGETTVAPGAMGTTFGANETGPMTQVFSGSVSLPAYSSVARGVGPWVTINLDLPYGYTAANGHLLIDIVATDPNGSTRTSYSLDCYTPGGAVNSFGNYGQTTSQPFVPNISVQGPSGFGTYGGIGLGGTVQVSAGSPLAAATPGVLVVGNELGTPLDLSAAGVVGSTLYVNPLVTWAIVPSGPFGNWAASFGVPNNANLLGAQIAAQALFTDSGAPSGFVTTAGREVTIGQTIMHANQLRTNDSTSATGFLDKTTAGGGPAMRLDGTFQ